MGTSRRHRALPWLVLASSLFAGAIGQAPTRDLCPETCFNSGIDPSNWTVVGEVGQLRACNRPLVLQLSINTPATTRQHIRACNVWANDFRRIAAPDYAASVTEAEDVVPHIAWTPAESTSDFAGRAAAQSVRHLKTYLESGYRAEERTILFATTGDTTVGVYVGARLVSPSIAENLFDTFLALLNGPGIAESRSALVQVCEDRTGNHIFGLIAAASSDFIIVHQAASQWSNGSCVDTASYAEDYLFNITTVDVVKPAITPKRLPSNNSTGKSTIAARSSRLLHARANCRAIQVDSGNTCATLLTRCGNGLTAADLYKYNPSPTLCSTLAVGQMICCTSGDLPSAPEPEGNADGTCRTETVDDGDDCGKLVTRCGNGLTAAQFYKYNDNSNLCSTLVPGQRVCCTTGKLPDIRPKQNSDGSCAAYQIQDGDSCSKIAVSNGLTIDELKSFNKDTWGWNGCDYGFWVDNWMCLSKGTPPFPAAIANANCGPQKPGTTMPAGSTSRDWAKLNPCPLNACCNIWGQCGTTVDFCVDTNTGAPGTAKKDTYGCISNCGMSIIQSSPPTQFIKLGYFEGFNLGRSCLNMDATQVDSSYTHLHFAFGMIDSNFNIYQESELSEFQFQQFRKIKTAKRIISFGGWVFSAEDPNYTIFREGVKSANRNLLADNLVKYVVDNDLDGLDLDWEYPSAPDLPGIPAGDESEAADYLRLLALLRSKLPKGKTLSIAAPASFWYLKQFPIKAMSELLDYIVYMTYDLHGQWDAGNKWSSPGCPSGNCLRSHVNRTETLNALTMITKAGVPSNKVLVGVSSYGRSFAMVDPSCTGPNCLFQGDRLTSYAEKGRCTDTAGYMSNAEINEIGGKTWLDSESNSDIMTNGHLWVSYMSDSLKQSRTEIYKRYSMGGTIDWAVDLAKFQDPPSYGVEGVSLDLTWQQVKSNIMLEGSATCDQTRRTGDWIDKHCRLPEVVDFDFFTPKDRWEALDCASAWDDVKQYWQTCAPKGETDPDFPQIVAKFLHFPPDSRCRDLSKETNCGNSQMCLINRDEPKTYVGACGYEIWNSMARLHRMLKNYYESVKEAGAEVRDTKDTFISTFAPKPDDNGDTLALLLSILQIPINIGGARFFASSFFDMPFFAKNLNGNKKQAMQDSVMGLVGVGFDVAKEALKSAADNREEIAFADIYKGIVGKWQDQVDRFTFKIFDGSNESLDALTKLFKNGKMITGRGDGQPVDPNDEEHTENWKRGKALQKAFYASAIPAAWTANGQAPVIADFGDNCEIDARDYFVEKPETYNKGWRCINGHSYILATVRDGPSEGCSWQSNTLPPVWQCPIKWTYDMLKGLDAIQDSDNDWAGITVDDLIVGAVNTYNGNNKKNVMDPAERLTDPTKIDVTTEFLGDLSDQRLAGFIHIPICSAEEATANLARGRASKDKWYNYPCNA